MEFLLITTSVLFVLTCLWIGLASFGVRHKASDTDIHLDHYNQNII